jgi:hypothetical protein
VQISLFVNPLKLNFRCVCPGVGANLTLLKDDLDIRALAHPGIESGTNKAYFQVTASAYNEIEALSGNAKGSLIAEFDSSAGHLLTLTGKESQSFDISGKNVGSAETTLSLNYLEQSNLNSTEITVLRNASAAREKLAAANITKMYP